ncbi:hypothetical protein EV368DRAFT_89101 [Lentinula lateritia]|nr:hypothetical protein EV368DRAFT_89101 [Lentinula lateritia]
MVEPRSVGSPIQTPLFLPEQESPTSPSPPPPSPNLPPLFGSVAPLSIDLTGDDDELYDAGEVDAVPSYLVFYTPCFRILSRE